MDEVERIKLAYSKRTTDGVVYSLFNPGQLFMSQQLEKELVRLFDRHGMRPLANKEILEVGCGTAWPLRELVKFGANPENLHGIDLLPHAIDEAKKASPNMDFQCGNAEALHSMMTASTWSCSLLFSHLSLTVK